MSVMEQVKKLKSHVKLVTEQDMKNKATKYLSRFQQVLKQVNKSVLQVKVKLVSMVVLMETSL